MYWVLGIGYSGDWEDLVVAIGRILLSGLEGYCCGNLRGWRNYLFDLLLSRLFITCIKCHLKLLRIHNISQSDQ